MKQEKKPGKPTARKSRKTETLEERVHRHLSDINSEITDEDIRSVKTELEVRSGPPTGEPIDENTNKEK
jgi:hypothetical protein